MIYYINIDELSPFLDLKKFYTENQLKIFNLVYKYLLIVIPSKNISLSYDKTFCCSNEECKIIDTLNLLEEKNFKILFQIFNTTQIINFAIENKNLDILEYFITTFRFTYYSNDFRNIFKNYFDINNEFENICDLKNIENLTPEKINNIIFYWILTIPDFEYIKLFYNEKVFNAISNHKQIFNIVLHNTLNKQFSLTNYIMLKFKVKKFKLRRSTLLWSIPTMFFFLSHFMHNA